MDNLDAIFDRYAARPKVGPQHFECRDGFTIVYDESTKKALYYFPGHMDDPLEMDVSPEQRDYLLKSKYWQRITA